MNNTGTTEKLTVLVPCKNEENNIRKCIESFRHIADEILIADSGSTDRTLEIVESIGGCRVIERDYRTSGDFKNWAIPQASNPWILIVDADERVTHQLAREITELLTAGPSCDGYRIYRDNHFMGHRIHFGHFRKDYVIRFFHRDYGRYEGPSDHGQVRISTGRLGSLRSRFMHYSAWSYNDVLRKIDRYTSVQAEQWHDAGRQPRYWRMLVHPIFRFFREYILKLGILDGSVGLQLAINEGYYSYLKQARLWQLHYGLPQLPIAEQDDEPAVIPLSSKNTRLVHGGQKLQFGECRFHRPGRGTNSPGQSARRTG